MKAVRSAFWTKNTARIIHDCQALASNTPPPKAPTATAMLAPQSMTSALTRARQVASDPRPDAGSPRLFPGYSVVSVTASSL